MKIYTIIGGVNGVGKSSLTGVLNSERDDLGIIIDTDILNVKYGGDRIKGGHNILSEDVIRRYETRFESLAKVLPYCNEVHFYDNENGFVDVGGYRNGRIFTTGEYIPEWLKGIKEKVDK